MRQYEMFELCFREAEPEESHVYVNLEAEFELGGKKTHVKGFYAGNGVYKVRYYPSQAGICNYEVKGIISVKGQEEVGPAERNVHGMVKTRKTHFYFEDGTVYYPFGTTVYAMLHQEKALMEQTLATLEKAPFNKIRICVFPKDYLYNQNEPEWYPFCKKDEGGWDVNRPCFPFWDALEKAVKRLADMDIQMDFILFHPYDRWGFAKMAQRDNLTYLEYLLRRLAAFPNLWWSMANEYDLCERTVEEWEEIEQYLADNDPYRHLLSNHNCYRFWDFSRENITHMSIQTKMFTRINEWSRKYCKPVMVDECCYEGNLRPFWGSISGKEMTRRFWRVVTMGGYCTHGETFLSPKDDVIWWAKGGVLKGESPVRIAFLRSILEELPGPLEGEPTFLEKMAELSEMSDVQRETAIGTYPADIANLSRAFLRLEEEMPAYIASEGTYQGHCGKEAYLTYYDTRCCAEDYLELPDDKAYRIELIDTWNMTRCLLADSISGRTRIELPGREDMAVLAVAVG